MKNRTGQNRTSGGRGGQGRQHSVPVEGNKLTGGQHRAGIGRKECRILSESAQLRKRREAQ